MSSAGLAWAYANRPTTALKAAMRVKPSVILIGGFFGKRHQLLPLQHQLWKAGLLPVSFNYYAKGATFQEQVDSLAESIMRHRSHTESTPLHFVTHCYGGLVLRGALRKLAWGSGGGLVEPSRVPPATATPHADLTRGGSWGSLSSLWGCEDTQPWLESCRHAQGSRIVMLAPPSRGSCLARRLHRSVAGRAVLGAESGAQLGTLQPEQWRDLAGDLPAVFRRVHIVAGTKAFNPLLTAAAAAEHIPCSTHDGVLAEVETHLHTPFSLGRAALPHSLLLYSPAVWRQVLHALTQDTPMDDWELHNSTDRSGTAGQSALPSSSLQAQHALAPRLDRRPCAAELQQVAAAPSAAFSVGVHSAVPPGSMRA